MIKKVAFFTFQQEKTAIEQYRIYSPLKHAGIEVIEGVVNGEVTPLVIQECDLVLTQRDFARSFEDYKAISWISKSAGKPFVLDLDDNILSLPKEHPDRVSHYYSSALPGLLQAVIEADLVTVSTENLKKELLELNPNISLLPNCFDPDLWEIQDQSSHSEGQPVRILYMGSHSHKPDIESIGNPLLQVAQTARRKIKFIFIGIDPPEGLENFAPVERINGFTFDYIDFIEKFSRIEADLAIAPLVDSNFNRSKSPIKFFEYSAIGLPVIASAIEPYSLIIKDGETGLLSNSEPQWVEKINILIENAEIRKELVQNARASINKNYLITQHASSWKDAYESISLPRENEPLDRVTIQKYLSGVALQISEQAVKQKTEQKKAENSIAQLENKNQEVLERVDRLESMNQESLERIDRLESKNQESLGRIDALRAKVAAKDDEITQIGESLRNAKLEIVDYTTSTSWIITRPFRRVGRWIKRWKNA